MAVYFEIEKVKSFLKNAKMIETLQARQSVLEKNLFVIFLEKKIS